MSPGSRGKATTGRRAEILERDAHELPLDPGQRGGHVEKVVWRVPRDDVRTQCLRVERTLLQRAGVSEPPASAQGNVGAVVEPPRDGLELTDDGRLLRPSVVGERALQRRQ